MPKSANSKRKLPSEQSYNPRTLRSCYSHLTPQIQMRARSLYLLEGLPPSTIAKQLNCDSRSIRNLIYNRGWCKLRAAKWAKADAELTNLLNEEVAQVSHQLATHAEDLATGTMTFLRESLDARNAKDLSMASTAARNLVEIARKSRNLDSPHHNQYAPENAINFFVIPSLPVTPASTKNEKNVTPAPLPIDAPTIDIQSA